MNEITAALHGARRIALVSHRDPDPDTIGSALALGLGLESLGKQVSWHCADPVPEQQRFLHGSDRFTQEPPPEDVDLVVTVDFGSVDRAKFALPSRPKLVNIDHHASNDHFGAANLVDVTAAASAELVSRVIDALGIKWTPAMATAPEATIITMMATVVRLFMSTPGAIEIGPSPDRRRGGPAPLPPAPGDPAPRAATAARPREAGARACPRATGTACAGRARSPPAPGRGRPRNAGVPRQTERRGRASRLALPGARAARRLQRRGCSPVTSRNQRGWCSRAQARVTVPRDIDRKVPGSPMVLR